MKKLAVGPLLLAAAVFLFSALTPVPTKADARFNIGGIIIDVDSHPPAVGIGSGAVIIFVRRSPLPGSDVIVVPDKPAAGAPQLLPVQVLPPTPESGFSLVSAYLVRGSGTANFAFSHKPVSPAPSVIDHIEIDVPDIH